MRQADWIIFTGQTRFDPDMAHRPGVRDVTPNRIEQDPDIVGQARNVTPTRWQRITRRLNSRLAAIADQARIAATFAGAALAALVTPTPGRVAYV